MLEEQEIGRELFGYKKDDVDRLLAELHRELRLIKEENARFKERLESTETKLASREEVSGTLEKTMVDAEKAASQIVERAQKEADMITARANKEASNIIEAADTERQALESGHKALETAEQELHAKVKSILSNYMSLVESVKPEATVAAKKAGVAVPIPPDTAKAVAKRGGAVPPENRGKLLLDTLSHLGDIQGVSTTWVFDNKGAILSAFNRLKIDLPGITAALVSLDDNADRLVSTLQEGRIKLMFMQLNKLVLIINPITETTTLGVIASVNAPIGQILWYLDKAVPELRNTLS